MSVRAPTLYLRVGHALELALRREATYWTASLLHGTASKGRRMLAFVHVSDQLPRTHLDDEGRLNVWFGGVAFEASANQHARIEGWIAANETGPAIPDAAAEIEGDMA